MRREAILIILIFSLGACAPRTFCQSDPSLNSPQGFEKDRYECDLQANQYAHQFGATGNIFIMKSKYDECMKLRGWVPCSETPDQKAHDEAMRKFREKHQNQ